MALHQPGISTLAVHAGARLEAETAARAAVRQTALPGSGSAEGAAAPPGLPTASPAQAVLEERLAALEGGTAAVAAASGQAAQLLVFHTLMQSGDNFVAASQLHGGSVNGFGRAFGSFGWEVRWADLFEPESFSRLIDERTRAVFIGSVATPSGAFADLEAIAEVAHRHGLPLIVDNTLASPCLVRPIEWGADIVVHSLNRAMGGHGNSRGGMVVDGGTFDWSKSGNYPMLSQSRPEYDGTALHDAFGNTAFAVAARQIGLRDLGPAIAPANAFMILTGLETLPLRVERQCSNAVQVADWLFRHPKVAWVSYPGLQSDPNWTVRQKYAPDGAGSVFTIGLHGGYEAGVRFTAALQLFSAIGDAGDTRSLALHPASAAQRRLSPKQKSAPAADPGAIHLSIGIEEVADILADLQTALDQA